MLTTVTGKITLNKTQKVSNERKNMNLVFYVYDFSTKYDGLIGYDILKQLNVKIDIVQECIVLNGVNYNFIDKDDSKPCLFLENFCAVTDLGFRLQHLNREEHIALKKLLNKYRNIFFKEGDTLTFTNKIKHKNDTR